MTPEAKASAIKALIGQKFSAKTVRWSLGNPTQVRPVTQSLSVLLWVQPGLPGQGVFPLPSPRSECCGCSMVIPFPHLPHRHQAHGN